VKPGEVHFNQIVEFVGSACEAIVAFGLPTCAESLWVGVRMNPHLISHASLPVEQMLTTKV